MRRVPLLAIGASAGGPAALAKVLLGLPKDFPVATVIVQHVDRLFAQGMAGWLAECSGQPVRLARDHESPEPGVVLLAGSDDHLVCTAGGRLKYVVEPANYVYRPSIDVFFRSLAQHWSGPLVAVLLTGMGRDGAAGLRTLRDKGCHTIAQDRASSAVYGMPKAAAELDAAVEIVTLNQVAPSILRAFDQGKPHA